MFLDTLTYFLIAGTLLLVTIQVVASIGYLLKLRSASSATNSNYQPKAAIILALRGPDPYLQNTFSALLAQDYPDYTLVVIVDHPDDPVMQQIIEIRQQYPSDKIEVLPLENRHDTCSLKISALIAAIKNLDSSYEALAFIDGDTIPHNTWLRDLVAPLEDLAIGVTTGNRWYLPQDSRWGSLVRHFWNVGAVVQMWMNNLIWAGSMALRREFAIKSGLLETWQHSLSVDATLTAHTKKHNKIIKFVPSVMMINEEGVSLSPFLRWVQRQLVTAKSYGPGWIIIALHAVSLSVAQLVAIALLWRAYSLENSTSTTWLAVPITAYWSTAALIALLIGKSVRRIAKQNAVDTQPPSLKNSVLYLPALVLTHIAYPYALLTACFRRSITWRGIEYQIEGVNKIRMTEYRPYTDGNNSAGAHSADESSTRVESIV